MERIFWGRMLISLVLTFAVFLGAGQARAVHTPESSCVVCHSKLGGSRGEPVELWQNSVHQEVGTTCEACHGGDPKDAASSWMAHKSSPEMAKKIGFLGKPSEESIPHFCGKCHVNIKDSYLESQHGAVGMPNCVTCHSSHGVQRASLVVMQQEVCAMCHDNPKADRIESLVLNTRERLEQVSGMFKQYKAYLIAEVEDNLNKAEVEVATVGTILHTFTEDKIKARIDSVGEKIDQVASEIEGVKLEIKKRKKIGVGIIIFALGTAVVLYYYRKIIPLPEE